MLSRRAFLVHASMISAVAAPFAQGAGAAAVLTDDGLYRQPWFLDSFLELSEDLEASAQDGKRFVILWELKGCPSCRQTHLVNFAKPEIEAFIKENFDILQLNIVGAREVTDFDGEKVSEKRLAQKYAVRFTPTFQFFPQSSTALAARKPQEREVVRAQGYLAPPDFLSMFKFVWERAYEKGNLPDYLKAIE
jgi:thioredoxin-related protein